MAAEWIYIEHGLVQPNTIVAVSSTGLLKRASGEITPSVYRGFVTIDGRKHRIYRLIADQFLICVKRPEQIFIDHITHHPQGMNVNDVRNLRWCTIKENCNFEEAIQNKLRIQRNRSPEWRKHMSEAQKGHTPWNKGLKGSQTAWNKGIHGAEYAEHFKRGFRKKSSSKEG